MSLKIEASLLREDPLTTMESSSKVLKLPENAHGEPPYLMTTEEGHKEGLQALSFYPEKENGIYLGFAFEFNYHVLATRNVQKAYICDINPRMHTLYAWVQKNVIETSDRAEFLRKFEHELTSKPHYYLGNTSSGREVIEHFTSKEFSWLYKDRTYTAIRELYLAGKIVHLELNLSEDQETFQNLALSARQHGQVFDVIYLSNIPEWIYRSGSLEKMIANLEILISPKTILVDAKQKYWETGAPVVRVTSNLLQDGLPNFKPNPKRRPERKPLPSERTFTSLSFNGGSQRIKKKKKPSSFRKLSSSLDGGDNPSLDLHQQISLLHAASSSLRASNLPPTRMLNPPFFSPFVQPQETLPHLPFPLPYSCDEDGVMTPIQSDFLPSRAHQESPPTQEPK